MLLEFLDVLFDLRSKDYGRNESDDIKDTMKRNVLKRYEAEQQIKNETDPIRKDKMQYLFDCGITDFSDI